MALIEGVEVAGGGFGKPSCLALAEPLTGAPLDRLAGILVGAARTLDRRPAAQPVRVAQLREDKRRRPQTNVGNPRALARNAQNCGTIREWLVVAEDQSKLTQCAKAAVCRPLAVVLVVRTPEEAAPDQFGGDDAVARHPAEDFAVALGELRAANAPPRGSMTSRWSSPVVLIGRTHGDSRPSYRA
jgi:hypothetical protein